MPESIHTKDESKRGSAFAFIFGVNWPVQWVQSVNHPNHTWWNALPANNIRKWVQPWNKTWRNVTDGQVSRISQQPVHRPSSQSSAYAKQITTVVCYTPSTMQHTLLCSIHRAVCPALPTLTHYHTEYDTYPRVSDQGSSHSYTTRAPRMYKILTIVYEKLPNDTVTKQSLIVLIVLAVTCN